MCRNMHLIVLETLLGACDPIGLSWMRCCLLQRLACTSCQKHFRYDLVSLMALQAVSSPGAAVTVHCHCRKMWESSPGAASPRPKDKLPAEMMRQCQLMVRIWCKAVLAPSTYLASDLLFNRLRPLESKLPHGSSGEGMSSRDKPGPAIP